MLVAVAGYFLAGPTRIDLGRLALLVVAGGAASAGASMLNHYLDRDVDARMRRTRHRPLVESRIAPGYSVAVAGLALSAAGIGAAAYGLNPLAGISVALGSLTYVVVYTWWLKRRTSWNIVIGGFAGSAPALAGSAAAVGSWTPEVLAFALLVFLWTPPHFWSLAIYLRDDYRAAGLPMLPKMDDLAYSGRAVVLSTVALLPATALMMVSGVFSLPILVALPVLGGLFVARTAPLWRSPERSVARRGFVFSGIYLLAVIAAVAVNWALLAAGILPIRL